MKRRGLAVAAAAAAAAAAALAAFRLSSPVDVDVFEAKFAPIEEIVTSVSTGTVRSRWEATAAAEAGGRVSQVAAREGEAVARGQVLATLSDPEVEPLIDAARAEVDQARELLEQARARRDEARERYLSGVARAEANLRKAREDHRRARELHGAGFLSKAELDQADAALANAVEDARVSSAGELSVKAVEREIASLEARIGAAKASLSALEERKRKLVVRAPFGGILTRRTVEVGEVKAPGAPLFIVADPRDIYIEVPVDESESARVRPGQKARLYPDAYLGETFDGTVTKVEPTIEASKEVSRANTLRIAPVDPPKPLRLGMSVDVEIVTGGKAGALQVPTSAVMEREGKKFVFVVRNGKVGRAEVTSGISNWERTEILSGLSPGDLVVTSLEIRNLKPGTRVAIRGRS